MTSIYLQKWREKILPSLAHAAPTQISRSLDIYTKSVVATSESVLPRVILLAQPRKSVPYTKKKTPSPKKKNSSPKKKNSSPPLQNHTLPKKKLSFFRFRSTHFQNKPLFTLNTPLFEKRGFSHFSFTNHTSKKNNSFPL
jgi:hypothetical protein